ncbi:hypothetical protein THAOC_07877, partial [Thalassiosira oceanica]
QTRIMGIHTDQQPPDAPHRIGGSSPSQSQHGTPRTRIVPGPDTTTSSLDNDPSSSYLVQTLNKRVKLERKNPTTLDLVSLPTKRSACNNKAPVPALPGEPFSNLQDIFRKEIRP